MPFTANYHFTYVVKKFLNKLDIKQLKTQINLTLCIPVSKGSDLVTCKVAFLTVNI